MRPASKVLRWTLTGYSGLVVRRLSRGKYIILCESSRSAGFKWNVLLLVTMVYFPVSSAGPHCKF